MYVMTFCIRLQRAFIAEHFDPAAVGVVGRDFAVVHHRVIEQAEGVRAAPPAGRVGRVAAVARPGIALVFVEAVKAADVFGKADALENAHVLAAGKDVRARDLRVDAVYAPRHIFALIEMRMGKADGHGREKVAEDDRLARHRRDFAGGDLRRIHDLEVPPDEFFRIRLRLFGIVKRWNA